MGASNRPLRRNYVVLQGYMVEDMKLSGNELVAYALIFGFCQAGRECDCSLRYFQFWLGCSKSTAIRVLDALEGRGYILRHRKTVNGVPATSYSLGPNAFDFIPAKPTLAENPQVNQWCQDDTTPIGGNNQRRSGGSVNLTPVVPNPNPIYKTDSDTDSESESEPAISSDEARRRKSAFAALKSVMPNTDGASFGFANYCALLDAGHGPEEIERAMSRVADALRADYPDRPARFLPHAERLLDPKNPSGVARFLGAAAGAKPSDKELFVAALTRGPRGLCMAAEKLNADFMAAASPDDRRRAVEARRAWVEENREDLTALCRRGRTGQRR